MKLLLGIFAVGIIGTTSVAAKENKKQKASTQQVSQTCEAPVIKQKTQLKVQENKMIKAEMRREANLRRGQN